MAYVPKTDFSLARLQHILLQTPEIISKEFIKCIKDPNNRAKLQDIIRSKLEPKDLLTVITLVTKIPWSILDSANFNILDHLISNEFFDNVIRYLRNIRKMNCFNKNEFFGLIRFYEVVMTYVPICLEIYEKFLILFEMSYKCLESFALTSTQDFFLFERMEELIKLVLFKAYYYERNQWHYSFVNMYPSPVDFFENRTLLPNSINGPYVSVDHYLDTHFKLLKEDFVCSVREGIYQYRSEVTGAKQKKNSSICLYKNVFSTGIFLDEHDPKNKIYHKIMFSEEDIKTFQEENLLIAKKFLTGSLLFFSRNDFTTFVVATVEDGGEIDGFLDRISNGINVSVIGNPYLLKVGWNYNMIEPLTFFEPYHQALKTLQSINPNNFPLVKNIVFTDMTTVPSGRNISLDNSNLNTSQKAALEAAISQKFSVIQGPPGTGKSYLARAIISTLVNRLNPIYPILVVCVRNNALDLVLEPLIASNIKVIRLGRQSRSETLSDLSLSRQRKELRVSCGSKQLLSTRIRQYRDVLLDPQNKNCPEKIESAFKGYSAATESLNNLLQYHDARKLMHNRIQVIGATTAGAARHHSLLSYIKPRVVIIEEAAEVMEPFIVSSIPEGCNHVILIGDHLQLQPTPSWHPSTIKYRMNISLFERMIKNGMEYHQLNEQHRMRPEIAALISPLIYKNLLNHPSVCNYENVRGMAKNVFFMTHDIKEDEIEDDSESHWNFHEADFLLALAKYLVNQKYDPSCITILATYAAQHQYMKKEVPKYSALENLQIQVVDNYQGEENDIILLSLVRSQTPTVGFLSKMNRINVALSRAKQGLFMVGNMKTLSKCYDGWMEIANVLTSQEAIGNTLPLQCQSHKNITQVSTTKQLLQRKYGGCDLPCQFKMKCEHLCSYPCHVSEELHEQPCHQKCLKYRTCGHKCYAKCFEICESILCKKIKKFTLSCSHTSIHPCSFNFEGFQCKEICSKLLACGRHRCSRPCFMNCGPWPCVEPVMYTAPCSHTNLIKCCDISTYRCLDRCAKMNSCGLHQCKKFCYLKCGPCLTSVMKVLKCGHSVMVKCSDNIDDHCEAFVENISKYCHHPYLQKCHEIRDGIKYEGVCVMGCAQKESLCSIS